MVKPEAVPGPVIVSVFVLSIIISRNNLRFIDFSGLKFALIGRFPGAFAGAFAISILSVKYLSIILGSLVLMAVGGSLIKKRFEPTPVALLFTGIVSGFMSSTISMGGPPMALVYQHQSADKLRGTISGFLIVGTLISLLALHLSGKFGLYELVLSIILLPGTLIGFFISKFASKIMEKHILRPYILIFSSIAAIVTIAKNLI